MLNQIFRKFKVKRRYKDIDPEDIFLDSTNLPGIDYDRFQGHIEKPISTKTFLFIKCLSILVICIFGAKLWGLQVAKGDEYEKISENNRLAHSLIIANRGLIYDRNGVELASNSIKEGTQEFADRVYTAPGLSHVLGYVKYPMKDSSGFFYQEEFKGVSGVEKQYNNLLSGKNGLKITETDALGKTISENVIELPHDGKDLHLSVDAKLTENLYENIKSLALDKGFQGGAAVVMDVKTGEVLAMTSYPEFDPNVVTKGDDREAISKLLTDPSNPFLNRIVSGLYTPGSIVKPLMALGALSEGVIDPLKKLLSTGSISLPNPYDPEHPSVFKDWRANGWVDMRDALAVSSDVYFYEVGGGFQDQHGLGISNIDKYFSMFGLTEETGIDLPGETSGVIATPDWKNIHFPGDPWRIGDTYHTSIGQYGTQVTPLEAVRWVGSIANGGDLLVPSILQGGRAPDQRLFRHVDLPETDFQVVREGMRRGVTGGVAVSLNMSDVHVAAKTGTAELGSKKQFVNSWVTGFFPYEDPHYAFAIIMEKGPVENLVGGPYVMRQTLDWMATNAPEYFK
ncbi:hypothetical protein KW790_00515 [Candidatus Parcubacteria bacterium]|nr:hypothetical protein [Candidatus Parcubacteria bacterium]